MSVPTQQHIWTLAAPPSTSITKDNFKLETRPLPALSAGQVLVRVEYLSNDPVTRLILSGSPAGAPIGTASIGTVVQSSSQKYKAGDRVCGQFGWADYVVVPEAGITAPAVEVQGKPYASLTVLGSAGITAYQAIFEELKVVPEDVVVISGASGAVGSMAVQYAKKVVGAARVVGIAAAKKADWVKSIGADATADYHSTSFAKDLAAAIGPQGASKFLDLTGGPALDETLKLMSVNGHVAVAGNMPSMSGTPQTITAPLVIVQKGLTIRGFSVRNFYPRSAPAVKEIQQWIADGKVTTDAVALDKVSIQDVPDVYLKLFGAHKPPGKLITEISA